MSETDFDDEERLFLESEYNPRLTVANVEAIFERWVQTAEQARSAWPDIRLDIPYGDSPKAKFDFVPPAPDSRKDGDGPAPLVIFIHGGYWRAMDKSMFTHLAKPCREAGIGFALVGYELCPTVTLPEIVVAARAAVAKIIGMAPELGVDPDRVILCGHSAGGHLTGMCLLDESSSNPDWATIPPLLGAISISGLFDLDPIRAISVNETLQLDRKTTGPLSPLFKVPRPGTRLALAVGEQESQSFHEQSASLGREWAAHGAELGPAILQGHNHFTAVETLSHPQGDLMRIILEWVNEPA
ncbi:MAG: alpha/beta hydrolase [Rhodospirillaceae bacterium]